MDRGRAADAFAAAAPARPRHRAAARATRPLPGQVAPPPSTTPPWRRSGLEYGPAVPGRRGAVARCPRGGRPARRPRRASAARPRRPPGPPGRCSTAACRCSPPRSAARARLGDLAAGARGRFACDRRAVPRWAHAVVAGAEPGAEITGACRALRRGRHRGGRADRASHCAAWTGRRRRPGHRLPATTSAGVHRAGPRRPRPTRPGTWLLFTDAGGTGDALGAALRAARRQLRDGHAAGGRPPAPADRRYEVDPARPRGRRRAPGRPGRRRCTRLAGRARLGPRRRAPRGRATRSSHRRAGRRRRARTASGAGAGPRRSEDAAAAAGAAHPRRPAGVGRRRRRGRPGRRCGGWPE